MNMILIVACMEFSFLLLFHHHDWLITLRPVHTVRSETSNVNCCAFLKEGLLQKAKRPINKVTLPAPKCLSVVGCFGGVLWSWSSDWQKRQCKGRKAKNCSWVIDTDWTAFSMSSVWICSVTATFLWLFCCAVSLLQVFVVLLLFFTCMKFLFIHIHAALTALGCE